jgi:SOS response regulatory protein OraA/RecX
LAQKKWLSLKNLPPKVGQQKLVGFLSRRGFSWQTVKKVVDEIDKK